MSLNIDRTFPCTMQIGSTTFNLDVVKFGRNLNNSPLIVPKPMTNQNGTNMPETLYKDLKIIRNTIDITFRIYSTGSTSPIAVAENIVDKLHKEAPPITITYRSYPFTCVFNSFSYTDDPKVLQKYYIASGSPLKSTYGGNNSPNYILCTINLTKGNKRI